MKCAKLHRVNVIKPGTFLGMHDVPRRLRVQGELTNHKNPIRRENSSNVFNNQLRIFGYFHFPAFCAEANYTRL